ncbi:MAG: hypothetical protein ACOC1J_01620, partial [Prolixibacteraceae bacterium]
ISKRSLLPYYPSSRGKRLDGWATVRRFGLLPHPSSGLIRWTDSSGLPICPSGGLIRWTGNFQKSLRPYYPSSRGKRLDGWAAVRRFQKNCY